MKANLKRPKTIIIAALLAVIAIALVSTHRTSHGGYQPPKTPPASTAPVKPKPPAQSERNDLNYFRLQDRSVPGLKDIWVTWSITNHSSKKSDYQIDWEAINSSGRVANGTEYTTNVMPGQTAKDSTPTTIDTTQVKIVVTKLDRTESFG